MGRVKIPYYVVAKGRGYWRPHPRMRAFGFQMIRCGPDGPDAWAIAAEWNKRWQAVRKREAPPLVNLDKLSRDQAEAARRYPPGSIGAAFQVYIRTPEWACPRLFGPDQSLVASMVSDSGYVGRCRAGYDHV